MPYYRYPDNRVYQEVLVRETMTARIVYGHEGVLIVEKEVSEEDRLAMEEEEKRYREECDAEEDWYDD